MCGIAGIMDLAGRRPVPEGMVRRMARALTHRGPDEEGFMERAGLALASRRLRMTGQADGQQPMYNEDRKVAVVFNGELFDHAEKRAELVQQGHTLATHCDTGILPHLWEELYEGMFERLRGQFAIAMWDERLKQLTLARDRFGIAPLYWTQQNDWLLFASEIKALLASGMVPSQPDRRGLDHVFTFSALPGPITCFEGIQLLSPGHFLQARAPKNSEPPLALYERSYWKMDFPDEGSELDGDAKSLVDTFEKLLFQALEKRLRADVSVGAHLSGDLASNTMLALSCHLKGSAINPYSIHLNDHVRDELKATNRVAKHVGANPPIVLDLLKEDLLKTYPQLVYAAETPVIDTSCAALLQLAQKVHANGQQVVLTSEGANEWLLGAPVYKTSKMLDYLDVIPSFPLSDVARRAYLFARWIPQFPRTMRQKIEQAMGGPNAWIDAYSLLGSFKLRFYADPMKDVLARTHPWEELGLELDRAKQWHPLNRGIWVAARVNLAGHLLQAKGDRVFMNSSVKLRHPFLDEDVYEFLSRLHPKWKLNGFRDKYLLHLLAERWLPKDIYKRGKVSSSTPLPGFNSNAEPAFVRDLLSEASLRRTGYFDVKQVLHWRKVYRKMRTGSLPRLSVERGLAAVMSTQLWHHQFIEGSLSELPSSAGMFDLHYSPS